ncbi:aminotransferase class IV [Agrococcus sp. ProA11]|uniref:aminotransferase class IV n=1 Tax=Agrococcus chionoecetis TaxID=3153752 RepID=UPI0032612FE2
MSGIEGVRAWTHSTFLPVEAQVTTTLAADSWLVVDGRVLAFERHRRRFADAVAEAGGDPHEALAASAAATQLVPPAGRWSPRLDLTPEGIRLRLRPAPEPSRSVTVTTAQQDPRSLPLRKGPDLAALGRLQAAESERVGASIEPIITVDGLVAESAWSAVLWWRGDALCVPDARIPRLPSVTAAVLRELARRDAIELQEESATPADLDGCEIWLANALRGIRAVSDWVDGPRVAPATRAADWQRRLEGERNAASVIPR